MSENANSNDNNGYKSDNTVVHRPGGPLPLRGNNSAEEADLMSLAALRNRHFARNNIETKEQREEREEMEEEDRMDESGWNENFLDDFELTLQREGERRERERVIARASSNPREFRAALMRERTERENREREQRERREIGRASCRERV